MGGRGQTASRRSVSCACAASSRARSTAPSSAAAPRARSAASARSRSVMVSLRAALSSSCASFALLSACDPPRSQRHHGSRYRVQKLSEGCCGRAGIALHPTPALGCHSASQNVRVGRLHDSACLVLRHATALTEFLQNAGGVKAKPCPALPCARVLPHGERPPLHGRVPRAADLPTGPAERTTR